MTQHNMTNFKAGVGNLRPTKQIHPARSSIADILLRWPFDSSFCVDGIHFLQIKSKI